MIMISLSSSTAFIPTTFPVFSVYGRITSGVKLINLKENDTVASVAKVRKASAEIDGEEVEISDEDESEKSEEGSVSETTEQETTEE